MGSLSGRRPEGSWKGLEKETTPATTGTGQRSVERQGGMGRVREQDSDWAALKATTNREITGHVKKKNLTETKREGRPDTYHLLHGIDLTEVQTIESSVPEAREPAQWVKCLLHKQEGLSSDLQYPQRERSWAGVPPACNPA